MSINRRKFIQLGSVATANLAIFSKKGVAAILSPSLEELSFSSTEELRKYFIKPADATKSSCYWWWFNGLIDKEGITRDLEEFRDKGMGGVLLVNSAGGLGGISMPLGVKFLSEEWRELYRYALKEADRLNIEMGMNLSSGWCMGGPWIKPENAGRWFLQSKLTVTGPQKFTGKLPLPGNRDGYDHVFNPPGYKEYIDLPLEKLDYRDTAIVAIPEEDLAADRFSGIRKSSIPAKTNRKDASNFAKAVDVMGPARLPWRDLPSDKPVAVSKVIDLSGKLNDRGELNWDVPQGTWTIIRTGHRMTGSRLMIAQPEADGLSVDWLDSKGVDIQFEHMGKMLLEDAGKLTGKTLKYFCDDSFEDGFPNWTTDILDKFKKFCGYDATPYLPVLNGYIIGSATVSDRFLNDYRKTVADCMANQHYKRFADLCHENGLLVQNESAGPSRSGTMCMDGLKNLGRSDMPMGEFWLGLRHDEEGGLANDLPYGISRLENGQNKVTKMVASAAHIYGKETASAEAFTTMRHWSDSPATLKPALDRAFCEGINRIVIHTSTATRPKDGLPGYEYGAGTHFNPNVTWWSKSAGFLSYIGRSQHLLRQGKFVADVLYYNGDWAPNIVEPKHTDPSLGKGYDYDVCNEEVLLTRLAVKNGKITLPDGLSYHVLVLPESDRMPLAVAEKLKSLVNAGAILIGRAPEEDSGLKDYPQCDEQLTVCTKALWGDCDGKKVKQHDYGKGIVYCGIGIREVLLKHGVVPDFIHDGEDAFIDFIHRSTADAEIYFLTNRNNKTEDVNCTFRIEGRQPELWDAVSGGMEKMSDFKEEAGLTKIKLQFEPHQSMFIVFNKYGRSLKSGMKAKPDFLKFKEVARLAGPWTVQFDPKWGGPAKVKFQELTDWSKNSDDRIRYYSGTARYIKKFDIDPAMQGKALYVDLGKVKNIAEVFLNGKPMGVVWTDPWRADLSSAIKLKNNLLEIEVINLWPNRLIGDAALPEKERLTHTNIVFKKDDKLLESGLLGPVILQIAEG